MTGAPFGYRDGPQFLSDVSNLHDAASATPVCDQTAPVAIVQAKPEGAGDFNRCFGSPVEVPNAGAEKV